MNWLAIIVITTNVGHVITVEKIQAPTQSSCEVNVQRYIDSYDAAPAKYFYECIDIGSIVRGE